MNQEEQLKKYFDLTGQDFNYLMEGANQFGIEVITDEIVPEALAAGRKIVWIDTNDDGGVKYELQPV